MERLRPWAGAARRWRVESPTVQNSPAPAADRSSLHGRNVRVVAGARLLLAICNMLVLYLDDSLPRSGALPVVLTTYGSVLLMLAYSVCVWYQASRPTPPAYLARVTPWLDLLFSAALIAATNADTSPFFMWNVFTVVGTASTNGWRSAIRVGGAAIVLYIAICLPDVHEPEFAVGRFLVRSSFLFVIALVLAYMGQQLLERNRILAGLHEASAQMSTGRTTRELLGRIADSVTELLDVESVAVGFWGPNGEAIPPALVNMAPEHAERLLRVAGDRATGTALRPVGQALLGNVPGVDRRLKGAEEALAGVRNVLMIGFSAGMWQGALVACNRPGPHGFSRPDQELIELLAAQAGPVLATARLQEQGRYHAGIDERHRIAAELHDGLIQTLAALDLRAHTSNKLWSRQEWDRLGDELRLLKERAEEALDEARGALHQLAPVRLREQGLNVYLEECLRRFHRQVDIPAAVSIQIAEREIPEPTALLLISLLREGLNNIRKHARAAGVTLVVAQEGEEIRFWLQDNGVGFRPEQCLRERPATRHFGLAYLSERIAETGGELQVISAPGDGTILEARMPLLTEERVLSLLSHTAPPTSA